MTLKIGSLFSGTGALDHAVEAVTGATPSWFCEFDEAPSKILAHHWPGIPNHRDVTQIDWSQVEPVDILTGGYPCQPFSQAGERKGTNDDRHLWPHIQQAISYLRPKYAFLENVKGHLTLGFEEVITDLNDIGYSAKWTLIEASSIGAPHHRARIFILAEDKYGRSVHGGTFGRRGMHPTDVVQEGSCQSRYRNNDVREGPSPFAKSPFKIRREHFEEQEGLKEFPESRNMVLEDGGSRSSGVLETDQAAFVVEEGERGPGYLIPRNGGVHASVGTKRKALVPRDEGIREESAGQDGRTKPEGAISPAGARPDSYRDTGRELLVHPADDDRRNAGGVPRPVPQARNDGGRSDIRDFGTCFKYQLFAVATPTDSHGIRPQASRQSGGSTQEVAGDHNGVHVLPGVHSRIDWGRYVKVIRRWETVLGRLAPEPAELNTKGDPRLNAAFAEWMMGLPAGHVTGVPGLSRADQLKAIGNGVCPQQAIEALTQLLKETP